MFDTNRLNSQWFWTALICFAWVSMGTCSTRSLAQEYQTTTAHFTPPEGCVPDPRIAAAGRAVQACIERLSPTHEFIIALRVQRFRPNRPGLRASTELARQAVEEHVAQLRKTNRELPGQTLLSFDHTVTAPTSFPPGANYCELVHMVQIDRRVPGYEGEEYRIWGQDFICARADLATNRVDLLDLRASERFRVATDAFRERFKNLVPSFKAFEAAKSLRFNG